jgi:hypothetical protein
LRIQEVGQGAPNSYSFLECGDGLPVGFEADAPARQNMRSRNGGAPQALSIYSTASHCNRAWHSFRVALGDLQAASRVLSAVGVPQWLASYRATWQSGMRREPCAFEKPASPLSSLNGLPA